MEFNRGVFDYLIATDEAGAAAPAEAEEKDEQSELLSTQPQASTSTASTVGEPSTSKSLKRKRKAADKTDSSVEYGVSRGIDFVDVACVLNFDLPASTAAYTHRIGRTARAGRSGMALSFIVPRADWGKQKAGDISLPSAKHDEKVWRRIEKDQSSKGGVKEYKFDMDQVGAFRYRMEDGLRAVTRATVKEARIKEIKQEVLNSEKLKVRSTLYLALLPRVSVLTWAFDNRPILKRTLRILLTSVTTSLCTHLACKRTSSTFRTISCRA